MKNIKIVICGCLSHSDKFGRMLDSYDESVTIGCWDPVRERAERTAKLVSESCRVYETYEDVLADPEVTGLIIVTGNVFHREHIIKAAKAGKNVFVEHPLCNTTDDALAIRDAVKESGIKFFMTDPMVEAGTQYVKKFMQSGRLGKVLSVRYRYTSKMGGGRVRTAEELRETVEEMGGGVMHNTGLHPFHTIQYLLGQPEEIISGYQCVDETYRSVGYDQGGYALMKYPDGVFAFVETNQLSPGYTTMVEVSGTNGVIIERSTGSHMTEVLYRLNDGAKEDKTEVADLSRWTRVGKDELGPDPKDHVRYFVEMQAYDLPNDQVGTDPYSTHGLNIDDAVGLVAIGEAVYAGAEIEGAKPRIVY